MLGQPVLFWFPFLWEVSLAVRRMSVIQCDRCWCLVYQRECCHFTENTRSTSRGRRYTTSGRRHVFFFLMHGGEAQDAARPAKTAAHNKVLYSYNNNDTTEQLTHTHRSTVALFTEAYDYAHFNTMVYKKCRLQPWFIKKLRSFIHYFRCNNIN